MSPRTIVRLKQSLKNEQLKTQHIQLEMAQFTSDGKMLLVSDNDYSCVDVHDAQTGAYIKTINFPRTIGHFSVRVTSDDQFVVVSTCWDGNVYIIRLCDGVLERTISVNVNIYDFVLSPDDNCIIAGSTGHSVDMWSLTGAHTWTHKHHKNLVSRVALSCSKYVVTSSWDHTIVVSRYKDGGLIHVIRDIISVLCLAADSRHIVSLQSGLQSGLFTSIIRVFRIETGALVYKSDIEYATGVDVSAKHVATVHEQTVHVYNLSNLQKRPQVFLFPERRHTVKLHPNGKQIVAMRGGVDDFALDLLPICDWSDRDHHLFDPTFKKLVLLIMCIRARLERTSTQRRGLPRLPMAVWLVFFQCLHARLSVLGKVRRINN